MHREPVSLWEIVSRFLLSEPEGIISMWGLNQSSPFSCGQPLRCSHPCI
ncbi:rCG43079, isoform CRA_a [Rattus norvegicus]|uniref:RCG43079, isoform CRA_a n=1 Tax=Rattus norvegicus TaxID=10116 RepID=A6IWI9_RAT|nr:rCG43079, isoform CRA_a [Rattus norvegicus]EDM08883.1 rCG43079, isoform CRA_a [Rattus norvegicus]